MTDIPIHGGNKELEKSLLVVLGKCLVVDVREAT